MAVRKPEPVGVARSGDRATTGMAVREMELAALLPGTDPPQGHMAEVVDPFIEPFRRVDPPPPRQAHGFYTDTTVCIGCKACEVA